MTEELMRRLASGEELRDEEAYPLLLEALDEPAWRLWVGLALANLALGDAKGAESILRRLLAHKEVEITQEALEARGWHRYNWVDATIAEWWKGSGGPASVGGRYLSARFDSPSGRLLHILVSGPFVAVPMRGVKYMEQLDALWQLLGEEANDVPG